ncbi:MAG: hypothetical protein NTV86_03055 [Planctomycetota bacterium]|nr:hypothetical protein [Planctomycetota bacterium]
MPLGARVPKYTYEDKSLIHLLGAYFLSALGSVMAIGLAFTVMFLPDLDWTLLLSPVVQQTAKPAGTLWVLERRPLWFRNRFNVFTATLLAAVAFGVLESLAWVGYKHLEGQTFAHFYSYRCAGNILMHIVTSAILAIGLAKSYQPGHKHVVLEYRKLLPYYAAAILVHLALNLTIRYLCILRTLDYRTI